MSVWPVAIQMRALEETGIILQNPQHPRQGGCVDAGIDDHPTIPADDNHHLPARRSGSHCRLGRSSNDDPREAGSLALRVKRLGTERAPPCHQQRT
jgi:hypothetical protein